MCSNSRLGKRVCWERVCVRVRVCVATYFLVLGFGPSIWCVLAAYGHTLDWRWFLFCCLLMSLVCRTMHHSSYIASSLSTRSAQDPLLKGGARFLCASLSWAWPGVWYLVGAQQMFQQKGASNIFTQLCRERKTSKRNYRRVWKWSFSGGKLIILFNSICVGFHFYWVNL